MNVYEEIENFYRSYRGKKQVIGKSALGRDIFAMLVGRETKPLGISQAAMHGREFVTAYLSEEFLRRGVQYGGVWVIPLANPDGALLSEIGISSVPEERRETLKKINGGRESFSLWKANADGVDLNVNFDARWGTGEQNVFAPASENYVGNAPFSAKESAALRDFTLKVMPDFTVSWHTKGEEIYWRFYQPPFRAARDKKIAKALSRAIGCPLAESRGSAGGYKDWCVEKFKIPAFTVEAGSSALSHPIGKQHAGEFAARYGDALRALTEAMKDLK